MAFTTDNTRILEHFNQYDNPKFSTIGFHNFLENQTLIKNGIKSVFDNTPMGF